MNSAIKLGLVIGVFSAGSVFAADGAGTVQRDVNQQTRIEQGLKSGELNTREAAKLEKVLKGRITESIDCPKGCKAWSSV